MSWWYWLSEKLFGEKTTEHILADLTSIVDNLKEHIDVVKAKREWHDFQANVYQAEHEVATKVHAKLNDLLS